MAWAYNPTPYQPYQETPYQQPPMQNGAPVNGANGAAAPWSNGGNGAGQRATWGGFQQPNNFGNNSGVVNPAANPYNPWGSWTPPPWWNTGAPGTTPGAAPPPNPNSNPLARGAGANPFAPTTPPPSGTPTTPPPTTPTSNYTGPFLGSWTPAELQNGTSAPSTPTYLEGPTAAMFGAPPQPPGTTRYNMTTGRWE